MRLLAQTAAVFSAVHSCLLLMVVFFSKEAFPPVFVAAVTLAALGSVGAAAWICREGK